MDFEASCEHLICPAHLEPKGECHCLRDYYRDMAVEALRSVEEYDDYGALDQAVDSILHAFGHDEPTGEQETPSKPPVSP